MYMISTHVIIIVPIAVERCRFVTYAQYVLYLLYINYIQLYTILICIVCDRDVLTCIFHVL